MRVLLFCLLLSCMAVAEPCTFKIMTFPPGAKVYVLRTPISKINNPGAQVASASFVGVSGANLTLPDIGEFETVAAGRYSVPFRLELDGHLPVQFNADNDLEKGQWPPEGVIFLKPANAGVAALDFLRRFWPGLLALVALAAVATVQVRRRHAAEKENRELAGLRHDSDPMLGSLVGKYRVLSMLGAGGMAVVYRARNEESKGQEQVALKVVAPQIAVDPEFSARFRREVQACMKLDHPNIIRLVDWGMEPPYLAMELVEGMTLREAMRSGPMPVNQVLSLMSQVLEGVAYAHSQGLIHRDLKPDNVMLHRDKLVKVMDFGLARMQEVTSNITGSGSVLGTPAYIAPEQIEGGTHPSADQYSLGIMAYEMLAGRPPFVGEPMKLLMAHLGEVAPPLRQFRPNVSEALEVVIMKMLSRNPTDRYETLLEVSRRWGQFKVSGLS